MAISVSIVEDDAPLRRLLVTLVNESPGMRAHHDHGDVASARRSLLAAPPDILLLDPGIHGSDDGLELLAELKERHPDLKVLIYSQHATEALVIRTVRLGAGGYVQKSSGPAQLETAIRALHRGEVYFPPSIAAKLAEEIRKSGTPATRTIRADHGLTPREQEVLELASTGLDYKQISTKLSCAYNTVRKHFDSIRSKLNASSGREAVAKYLGRNR